MKAGRLTRQATPFGEVAVDHMLSSCRQTTAYDLHATMLHLLGIDHKRLTHLHNGREYRLTDVAGEVLTKLLS